MKKLSASRVQEKLVTPPSDCLENYEVVIDSNGVSYRPKKSSTNPQTPVIETSEKIDIPAEIQKLLETAIAVKNINDLISFMKTSKNVLGEKHYSKLFSQINKSVQYRFLYQIPIKTMIQYSKHIGIIFKAQIAKDDLPSFGDKPFYKVSSKINGIINVELYSELSKQYLISDILLPGITELKIEMKDAIAELIKLA